MASYWLNVALVRVILPAILAGCTVWRPIGLSLVYLCLVLYSPFVPVPTRKSMNGHTGTYLRISVCLSFLVSFTLLTFHIVLLSLPTYGHFLQNCEFLEKLLRHVGLVRLDDASLWEICYWLAPEIIILPTTILVYVMCRYLTGSDDAQNQQESARIESANRKMNHRNAKIINFLGRIGTYVVLGSLCITASLRPSVEAAFYFLMFLGAGTWWACNKELRRGFAAISRFAMLIVSLHIVALLSYQNQWPQEFVPLNSTWARYFSLVAVYHTNCTDPRHVDYTNDAGWLIYGYPLRLFWLYYILALQSQFIAKKKPKPRIASPIPAADETTPLMRFGSGRTGLLQDSTGSVIVNDGRRDDSIQLQSLSGSITDDTPGIVEHILLAVYSIFQLIVNSSYLATNIIMMAWSIMYHSWTTFVLLLWALLLWMVPDKRASMMKWSPFIVFYATLLLLGQYVYSMDLNEDELPTVINGVKISEIGFSKIDQSSRWNLIIKCLFISMFWITMRQYIAERKRKRETSALRDMAAPLHISVSTATTSAINHETPEIKSKFMKDVGKVVKTLMTKFWIAVVAITLFICGITGERMTVFRIIYMSLFLFFVITFQMSWVAWRKMMYAFWLTVIGYSVIMLILVYTYQFHNFPSYWEYLYIDKDLQMDIGLEIYETKDLFLRLLTPTFFVIITVLQIHYFHQGFLEVTNIERIGTEGSYSRRASLGHSPNLNIPSAATATSPTEVILSEDERSTIYTLKQLKRMSRLERLALYRNLMKHAANVYNYTWLFLEIHMLKIIFFSVIILCVNDVCAINFFFVVTTVVMINFQRNIKILTANIIAAVIAILMVTKMLYQIKYIDHKNWDVNCTRDSNHTNGQFASNNTIYNIAEWIGMRKAEPGMLAELLKGYIGIITITTFRKIITVRQWFHRQKRGESLDTPQVMFPSIKRSDADKGLPQCFKFLLNYGFYKFGLEFCLIGIVALIGTRLDFFSVLYSVWLIILFSLKRKTVSRIWPILKIFAIVLLPIQYASVVAPPTWFCIDYPWGENEILRKLQDWMYFPDPDFPPNARKLICDFILLLMIVRQSLVFRIEGSISAPDRDFAAGHNYSVFQDMDKPNFVNPVKDYVSHIHCWLDIFKRGGLMSLMWLTLSIMFLAGTKRTNIFSLGYLIGAFVFLWQGSDFYLRPVKTILKWWNLLIGYNVTVIFCKALLQGVSCVLITELKESACWIIQLLGIACLKKFKSSASDLVPGTSETCIVPREDIGMVWDGLCFGFLLIQKRLFKSYYFFHIVDETKAMSILASRGAELLEELHQKRIELQDSVEKTVLQKLKFKMDKIKANQRKIQGPTYREPQTHKVDTLFPETRPLYRHRAPKTNREAVRSGDYYMFDDLDDDDLTDIVMDSEAERRDEERRDKGGRRMTMSELMTTLIKTDIEIATHVAMYGGNQQDAMRLRRRSVPLTRKKSSMSYLSARSDTETETETAAATDTQADRGSLSSAEIEAREGELATVDFTESREHSDDDKTEGKGSKESGSSKDETEKRISVLTYCKFIWVVLNSALISMTRYLNRFSRDYRYIRKVLAKEKKLLKAKPDFRVGYRLGISKMWQPIPLMQERLTTDENIDEVETNASAEPSQSKPTRDERGTALSKWYERRMERSNIVETKEYPIFSQVPRLEDEGAELSEIDQPPIIQLAASIWFGILAHSSLLCYFMVFLHQIKNASVLSTPLPLMVFCWGSLTIPRPSKTFWITLIAYTEAIVIVKCLFQLELIPWNQKTGFGSGHPLYGPRIIGVERKPNYALWDLLVLLMVFFHRFMLKSLGQWTASSIPRKIIPSSLTVISAKPKSDNNTDMSKAKDDQAGERSALDVGGAVAQRERRLSLTVGGSAPSYTSEEGENSKEKQDQIVALDGQEISPTDEKFSKAINITLNKYCEPINNFFSKILTFTGKEKTNVYAYMFLCDFFNFLLLIFGFSAFGTQQGDGGVAVYLQENRVPMPFLLMLLLQFALIVADRALFLRKSILGKLIFHYVLIFGVHIWMFFILPSVTERPFNDRLPPQIWYMVKCFYLLLAAYQLRQGYPTRILGNFLCKNYSIVNYVLFKGFMLIPFLFELRAVMDWIWTDTSMTIMDWFKMEDIFASIYQIKCMRGVESDFPQPRGVKKAQMSKYMVGGGALFVIIGLIWFPLLLFALGGTVGVSNLPYDVSMKIRIGSYDPIYNMAAQGSSIIEYSEDDFRNMSNQYSKDRVAVTFLENYISSDVAAVMLGSSSSTLWDISPPDRERLIEELESPNTVIFHIEWTVSRKTDAKDSSGVTTSMRNVEMPAIIGDQPNPMRETLIEMLNGSTNATVTLPNALPKFLKVTSRTTNVVPQLMTSPHLTTNNNQSIYRDIILQLSPVVNRLNTGPQQQWWVVQENCSDPLYNVLLKNIPKNNCKDIMLFLFNDKAFPEGLSFISGYGILGLYTTAVIVISQMMRRIVSDMAPKIMFDDMPFVDRILRLCLDIYLVRESGDLCLEEDLFAKLIFLYRSPETLIRWTRPPEPGEIADNENQEEEYAARLQLNEQDEDDNHVDDESAETSKRY